MKRAEVWWAELPSPAGQRPVVILTRDAVVGSLDGLVVALVTRTIRGLPSEMTVGQREGLPRPCVINFDNLVTAPRHRLVRQLGALSAQRIVEMDQALKFALGIA